MSNVTKLIAAAFAVSMIGASAGAFAAGPDQTKGGKMHIEEGKNADDCRPLEQKFDAAYATRADQKGADAARSERDTGAQMCDDGDFMQGISHLESALTMLGVSK